MKSVFFDVDTQLDFLMPAGALAVPGAGVIAGPLTALTQFATANQVQILSTADAHAEDDPEFAEWPPHCVKGSLGQAKASFTDSRAALTVANKLVSPETIRAASQAAQVIIEKQSTDCFTNVMLRPLLAAVKADRYIVYGVVAEICVQRALFGLLQTGPRVELVIDATQAIDKDIMTNMVAHFQAAGGLLTTVGAVTASRAA